MSETTVAEAIPAQAPKPKPARKRTASTTATAPVKRHVHAVKRTGIDLSEFKAFLATLGMPSDPIVHVNGAHFLNCVMTVDFGQPLVRSPKLTTEQSGEFVTRMRKLTREIMAREMNVRVSNDGLTGIYWTSVS